MIPGATPTGRQPVLGSSEIGAPLMPNRVLGSSWITASILFVFVSLCDSVLGAPVEVLINRGVEKTSLISFLPSKVIQGTSSLQNELSPGKAYFHPKDLPSWVKVTSSPTSFDCPASTKKVNLRNTVSSVQFGNSYTGVNFCSYSFLQGSNDLAKACISGSEKGFLSYKSDPQIEIMPLSTITCNNPVLVAGVKLESQKVMED